MDGQVLNISPIIVWVIALSQLLSFGLTLYSLFSSGSKKNAERLEQHGTRLAEHDQRLGAVEHTMRDIPTQRDFHELETQMTRMTGAMNVLSERMKPVEAITERLQEWIIEQGRK